jgi:N-acetylmuramoyl-L-alanine amidase
MSSYRVQQGDCLSSVAKRRGFDWKTIWDHPNNKRLRELRKDPNVLYPGDILFIPDKELAWEKVATTARHVFVLKPPKVNIRLRILEQGKPVTGAAYTLKVDNVEIKSGSTDGSGRIEAEVDADAREAHVEMPERKTVYVMKLGYLDPITETKGLQARLRQLGYYTGEVDGDFGELTEVAVWGFQMHEGLEPTGKADGATLAALEKAYSM